MIYDSLFSKAAFVSLPIEARLLIIRMFVCADDEGYGECHPLTFVASTFIGQPIDNQLATNWLALVSETGFVEVRTDNMHQWLYRCPKWKGAQHLRKDRLRKSSHASDFELLSTNCQPTVNHVSTNCPRNSTQPNPTQPNRMKPEEVAEDRSPAAGPSVLTFPTKEAGKGGDVDEWDLRQAQVDRWRELYPGVDVLAACRDALAKVEAGKVKPKTQKGMPTFLVNWIKRELNGAPWDRTKPTEPRGKQAIRDFLQEVADGND